MKIKPLQTVAPIADPYIKRILSNIIGKDAFGEYSKTPRKLQRLIRGLPVSQLKRSVHKGKWSITEIINHFYDSELVMGFRFRMAIAQTGSRLQAFDEGKWANRLRYKSTAPLKKLELFVRMRQDHIVLLRSLKPREWKLYGMHEERGKETIERMVQMMAGHDINHLRQVEDIRTILLRNGK
jgi:hypothetical protein